MSPLGSVACCRWNLALISRPALARNERNQVGPRPTEWVAYSCFSGLAESRIRVPWILSGSNGARIDVISLQQLSVSGCSSSAKSAFHGVGHRHLGHTYIHVWRHSLWWWIRKVTAGFVAGFRSVSVICMAALVCLCGGEASGSRNSCALEAQCTVPTGATRLHDSAPGSLARSR